MLYLQYIYLFCITSYTFICKIQHDLYICEGVRIEMFVLRLDEEGDVTRYRYYMRGNVIYI